jgi:hypothetical protein
MVPVEIINKRKKGICKNKWCRHECTTTLCNTCRSRKSRLADPVRYSYNNHKKRAAAAKPIPIPFDLTLEEYREFCVETLYIQSKSRQADGYTVDRINDDPAKGYWGYRRDNIQRLTNRENVLKEHAKRREKKLMLNFDINGNRHWTVRDDAAVPVDEEENYF